MVGASVAASVGASVGSVGASVGSVGASVGSVDASVWSVGVTVGTARRDCSHPASHRLPESHLHA